jgi:hypothetical protein
MKTFIALCLCGLSITASAQLKYSDTKYGVSFQYLKGYVLKKGTLGDQDTGMGYLGPILMEFVAPGGVRVVTIETPTDSYPGTDFVNAFFTVSINPYLTRGECDQFIDDPPLALLEELHVKKIPKEPVKTISDVRFQGVRIGFSGLGHQAGGPYYHGFSRGFCYELGYGIATAGYGAVDGMKQVDSAKVFSILENILKTVTIRTPARAGAANAPSIRAFTIVPLNSPPNSYRVSWDVEGVEAEKVWLSASCFGDLTILGGTGAGTEKSVFPCDVLGPAQSAKGSFDLEFKNMAGQEIKETIRLFAAGENPVSKRVTISVPPLADIRKQSDHQ